MVLFFNSFYYKFNRIYLSVSHMGIPIDYERKITEIKNNIALELKNQESSFTTTDSTFSYCCSGELGCALKYYTH